MLEIESRHDDDEVRLNDLSDNMRRFVPPVAVAPPFVPSGRYGERRTSWPAIGMIAASHAALLTALVLGDVIPIGHHRPKPTVIELVDEAPPPPPEPVLATPPPAAVVPQPIVAPPPLVRTPAPPVPIATAPVAPPAPVTAVAAPTPSPAAPPAPVAAAITPPDFNADYLKNPAPRYPLDSRRAREQGTVMLKVLVSAAGRVDEIKLARSSGFDRLDRAALSAVKGWKFAPAQQAGGAVAAWVLVPIPFVIQG